MSNSLKDDDVFGEEVDYETVTAVERFEVSVPRRRLWGRRWIKVPGMDGKWGPKHLTDTKRAQSAPSEARYRKGENMVKGGEKALQFLKSELEKKFVVKRSLRKNKIRTGKEGMGGGGGGDVGGRVWLC